MRLFLFLGLLLSPLAGAPLTRDLGRNLVYYRVHTLPDDLPPASTTRPQPCVLDLRYVRGDAAAIAALQAWVKFHASAHTPVLILANATTEAGLVPMPAPRSPNGSVIVLGAASGDFVPDIAVQTSAETERRAYDALETGADLPALLAENPDKVRNDEASLNKDRANDPDVTDEAPKNRPPRPPIDAALQRAVHLHRALVALKKL